VRNEPFAYQADGEMVGRIYWDESKSGPRPGVLVFPEGRGITDLTCRVAERLAVLGYVGLACDFFGGGHSADKAGAVDDYTMGLLKELVTSTAKLRARGRGAFEALAARPEVDKTKIAAIGYCFGGALALEQAFAGTPLKLAAGFHCGIQMLTMSDAKNVTCDFLLCVGADDPYVPASDRAKLEDAMRAAGKKWQLNLYGGVVHSFTNPNVNTDVTRYDAVADQDSWETLTRMLRKAFA
jgi:dienelactone hydrolase